MKHFLNTADWSRPALQAMIDEARAMKASAAGSGRQILPLKNKTVALLFLNNSLRTRTSFDVGAQQLGAHAVVLSPSGGMWPLEFSDGVIMDGEAEEHAKEAAKVLSRYCDMIGIRAFPKFENWQVDREDRVLRAFAKYADVPVINMESITHPCQEMAHIMALQERLGPSRRQEICAHLDLSPQAAEYGGRQFSADDCRKIRHEADFAMPDRGIHP